MSELEVEEVETPEVEDSNDSQESEPTLDDYKKLSESHKKAEERIVAQKQFLKKHGVKTLEELEAKISKSSDEYVKKSDAELDKFLEKNPDLAESRATLDDYQKKGIPLEDAWLLLRSKDETLKAREKTKNSRISDGVDVSEATSYSKAELERLATENPDAFDKAMNRLKTNKAKYLD